MEKEIFTEGSRLLIIQEKKREEMNEPTILVWYKQKPIVVHKAVAEKLKLRDGQSVNTTKYLEVMKAEIDHVVALGQCPHNRQS